MEKGRLNLKIGGAAGEGIKSVGLILSRSFVRAGYFTFDYSEYPSLIRGGHNTYQSHISSHPVHSQIKAVDILIALNRQTIDLHQEELTGQSLVIFDSDKIRLDKNEKLRGNHLPMPLEKLAMAAGGLPIMANNAALGAVIFLSGVDLKILKTLISQTFAGKSQTIILQNQKAAELGYQYAVQNFAGFQIKLEEPKNKEKKFLISGNEAVAMGAIAAGMKFFAAYPMTPTTGILHYLAGKAKKYEFLVKHAEDEISVINLALGASFAGARSMVATSGGGFDLMTEALGMAGMMELPVVIVEGMRSGPSTGMPTWHDQGDLKLVINASHGEFPRMVLTPGSIEECFYLTRMAFYFAEKYQLPAIVLIDKYLAESFSSLKISQTVWQNQRYSLINRPIDPSFRRYALSQNGISLRSLPGWEGGDYLSNSYEHDERGYATEESEERKKMVIKRQRKRQSLEKEIRQLKQPVFGHQDAETGLISWGSNQGPILEALRQLSKATIAFLHLNVTWPLPVDQIKSFVKNKKRLIILECNSTGQLTDLIREQTGLEIKEKLLKYDGRPFYPEEIINKLGELA